MIKNGGLAGLKTSKGWEKFLWQDVSTGLPMTRPTVYCAVVYFVCEMYGAFSVTLLTSKTRVAPLKTQTIPRLELMSGRVLAKTVHHALEGEVEIKGSRQWLDSKTALWWINNRGEWKQFVRQRVNEILRMTRKEDWAH